MKEKKEKKRKSYYPQFSAVDLHRRILNESLCREQRQYITPYEMFYSNGKPTHTTDKAPISCAAPLHYLQRFRCWKGKLRHSQMTYSRIERNACTSSTLAKKKKEEKRKEYNKRKKTSSD